MEGQIRERERIYHKKLEQFDGVKEKILSVMIIAEWGELKLLSERFEGEGERRCKV